MTSPIRLLIVDDHVMIRLGLAALMADEADIEIVGEASDGAEALARYESLRPDVTIMDGMLPDIHGVEASRRILSSHPDARIILVSINESAEDIHRAMEAGVSGYVPKSRNQEVILSAIRTVAAGERFLEPELARRLSARAATNSLTQREIDVLKLVASGLVNKQIGAELGLSENTVKTHISRIMGKLEVHDRTSLAMRAVALGLLR
ncbi:MAG: response regulator transcription factor [Akkermansiaceae bacterium]|jgi:DNA-binding NarL/FixJ family response regulator|nr:response regulator transcription factor [Akkermansiaceae bacterium]